LNRSLRLAALGDVGLMGSAVPGLDSRPAASSCKRSTRRATSPTDAPSSARRDAVARPIPLEAPVTRATVPCRGMSVVTAGV
jgi:hypothetical protein